ncbi:complement C5 [Callorhinchus milii]|uniref:complement C5 n=1 Tax=Callorhinchus milii TaxID=7868 RepID=UPI001C3F7653|nr:complement C5 [Callorhinchus milii]
MKLLSIISLWAFFESCGGQSRVYLITAPKILRVGASETVVAQTYGYNHEFAISISLKSYPDRRTVYAETVLILNESNKFQAASTLTILPKAFPISKDKPQYVYLAASSSDFTKEEKVPVSHQNGLLFIQTDKPVYTPDQSVKIRIYSLNEELKPAKRPVLITFKDPEGVKVDYVESEDVTGIISILDFKVPPNPKYGLWKIEAKYKSDFTTFTSTKFEIKEYVLPTFQISIKPEKNFISFDEFNSFKIDVMASHFHGEKIQDANVFLHFAILDEHGSKQLMPKAAMMKMLENGHVTVDFDAEYATKSIEIDSLADLHNRFLHIGVTVLDTSAGITEDAEYSDIIFTRSPYKITLVATPLFVKPNLPYHINAQVKDMKGSPVRNLKVFISATNVFDDRSEDRERDSATRITQSDGTIEFLLDIPTHIKELRFKIGIESDEGNFKPREYTAKPYRSETESYLYINWAANFQKFQILDHLLVDLIPSSPYEKKIRSFHFQVVSKGKIVSYGTKDRAPDVQLFNLDLPITAEMIPSARLIVYYLIVAEGRAELVVDSVWFKVEEKCMNNQRLTVKSNSKLYKPGSEMTLTINSRPNSLIALSSIDTAIYSIRTGSKISVEQVLLDAESLDLGCGAGGGKDNIDVFARAGLTFLTNANAKAPLATDLKCDSILRSKRDVGSKIRKKIATYASQDAQKCCFDGMKEYPVIQSCDERASRIKLGAPCKDIFLECCKFAEELRTRSQTELTLARLSLNNEFQLEPAHIRSFFPESWMWEVHEVSERSSIKTLVKTLPDSITTWEIQGVGISETGICVADPIKVTVFENVILKAKIPYSVVRGEQIQLKVAVYNYNHGKIRTCVTMSTEEGTCLYKGSETSVKGRQTSPCQLKTIEGLSAIPFTFTILPLELGVHTVNFTLKTKLSNSVVYVQKLRVLPQGVIKEKHFLRELDPSNVYGSMVRRIEIPLQMPLDIIPNTSPDHIVSIKGDVIGEALAIALNPEGVRKLTNLPSGSAESEVMTVAPLFFIYNYLEKTSGWSKLGPLNTSIHLNMKVKMRQGITSITSFRTRNNYAYSMWKNGEASTWLTAFVLRIFGEVSMYIKLDKQSVCNTMNWLIDNCQNSDGSFRELSSHVPLQMQRSLRDKAKESKMYLTAFTIIGIQKTSHFCGTVRIAEAVIKANNYLSANLDEVESTLVIAVVAYALGLSEGETPDSHRAFGKLKNEAFVIGQLPSYRFWKDSSSEENSPTARSIETTSYALLATLCSTDKKYANPIVGWLIEQQRYGGGFLSIQDTVIALEGLTKYAINMRRAKLDLSINVAYRRFGNIKMLELNEENPFAKPIKIEKNDNLILSSHGRTGRASVSVRTTYYTTGTSQESCDFSLTIDLSPVDSRILQPDTIELYLLKACARYNPRHRESEWDAVSGVMEIHLYTGLIPEEADLETLLNGVDNLILNYRLVDQSVIIQVNEIPSDSFCCVGFHVQKILEVDLVSPAPFTVYNDRQPSRKCTVFYKLPEIKKVLKHCNGDECKCMQAECSHMLPPLDTSMSVAEKRKAACGLGQHYAYKVRILSSKEIINFIKYSAIILQIYMQVDEVQENSNITLVMMESCSNVLTQNKDYFIMGKQSVQFRLKRSFMYEYPLDSSSWIEHWPSREDCHEDACERFLQQMDELSQDLFIFGCSEAK